MTGMKPSRRGRPKLEAPKVDATPEQRSHWRLIGGGQGIHWPDIDEDIAVATLLRPS